MNKLNKLNKFRFFFQKNAGVLDFPPKMYYNISEAYNKQP